MPPEVEFVDSLDAPEAEILNEPETPPETPPEQPRDPETGRFVSPKPEESAPAIPPTEPPVTPPPAAESPKPEEAPKVVPLAALLEERNRSRAEIAEANRKAQELESRLARLETPPAQPEQEPDFIEDPKGYVDAQTKKALDALQQVDHRTQQLTQAQQVQQALGMVAQLESRFVEKTPDYYDALNHVRALRVEQIRTFAPQATDAQIQAHLRQEEVQVALSLMQQGRDPSETLYTLAKASGYQPKAKTPAAPTTPAIPAVPKAPVGDPGQTLGSSGGAPDDDDAQELSGDDTNDMIALALAERFGRSK